jgi:hypothetical protein
LAFTASTVQAYRPEDEPASATLRVAGAPPDSARRITFDLAASRETNHF